MAHIHPTAIVSPRAVLADDVVVDAYSIIKGEVHVGGGTIIHEHSHLHGRTVIGRDCQIGPTAFVGLPPQHQRADPNIGELVIGDRVTIRETASVHRSIVAGSENATRIGDDCYLMAGTHVGHDCVLGHSVIMANLSMMGGHCHIGDRVYLGGGSALHQFTRVGRLALIGAHETITQEVPPFSAVRFAGLKGYNAVGCRRAKMSQESICAIRAAYRCLQSHRLTSHAIDQIRATVAWLPEVQELVEFLLTTKRGIVQSPDFRRPLETEEID